MVEEQQHGFAFQHWVTELAKQLRISGDPRESSAGNYTSKWDLPSALNPNPDGGPVSIKTAKWNSGIGFGDARRQFQIDETFTLIVGFGNAMVRASVSSRLLRSVCIRVFGKNYGAPLPSPIWKHWTHKSKTGASPISKHASWRAGQSTPNRSAPP